MAGLDGWFDALSSMAASCQFKMRTLLLPLVLLACGAAGSGSAARRLVAVADLHGDLGATMRVLQLAGLVDAHGGWTGGDAVLVQTGDIVDRGGEAKQIYELFRRLAEQAPSEGGEVHNLLGNHDAMNVLGDLRYVNQTDYAHFGGARARARAFSSAGDLGQWLRSRPVALHLGDTVFVHAGITAAWAAQGLDAINALMRAALSGAGGMSTRASVLGASGPVWCACCRAPAWLGAHARPPSAAYCLARAPAPVQVPRLPRAGRGGRVR